MRNIIYLMCAVCIAVTVQANSKFTISRFDGNVLCRTASDTQWRLVKFGTELAQNDSIDVQGEESKIYLTNSEGYVFENERIGKQSVRQLIIDNDKQNSNFFKLLYLAIWGEDVDGERYGDVDRGENRTEEIAWTFAWISKQSSFNNIPQDQELKVIKHKVGEYIYFEIQNNSADSLCVNVLHINKATGKVNLCYIPNRKFCKEYVIPPYICIPDKMSMKFNDILLTDTSNDIYIAIGSKEKYIPSEVQEILDFINKNNIEPTERSLEGIKISVPSPQL